MTGRESQPTAYREAIVEAAVREAGRTPAVRGADWQVGTVTAVNTGGTVDVGDIRARILDSYLNPAVGDQAVLTQNSMRNWVAVGRTASSTASGWVAYTPSWMASTTNPTIGNGSILGRYQKLGRTVIYDVTVSAGSTTTFGSGTYSFSLPFTSANAGCTYLGLAHIVTPGRWGGQVVISPNSNSAGLFMPTSGSAALSSMTGTVPAALTTNSQVRATVTYESAS